MKYYTYVNRKKKKKKKKVCLHMRENFPLDSENKKDIKVKKNKKRFPKAMRLADTEKVIILCF